MQAEEGIGIPSFLMQPSYLQTKILHFRNWLNDTLIKGRKYRISISHICWKYIRNRVFTVGYMVKNGKVKGFHLYNRGFKRNGFPVISLLTQPAPLCLVLASQAL